MTGRDQGNERPTISGRAPPWAGRVALAVLNGYLLSPILIQMLLGSGMGWRDPLLLCNLLTSLLWLALAHSISSRPFRTHLLLIPFCVTTAIDLFLLDQFGNRLSSGYVTIALTSYLDTAELLRTYASSVLLIGFVLAIIFAIGLYSIRHLRLGISRKLAAWVGASLLLLYPAVVARGVWGGATPAQAALDLM